MSRGSSERPDCFALWSRLPRLSPLRLRDELLHLGEVDRGAVVARLDAADLLAADGLDRPGDRLQHPEDVARIGAGERAELAHLPGVRAREVLGVALDPGLAGRKLLREQREVDVRRLAVLDRLELPVGGAAEVAARRAAEARAESLEELGEGREVDRELRALRGRVEAALGREGERLARARHRHAQVHREPGRVGRGALLRDRREARQLGNRDGRAATARGHDGDDGHESGEKDMGTPDGHATSMHRPGHPARSSIGWGIREARLGAPTPSAPTQRARPPPIRAGRASHGRPERRAGRRRAVGRVEHVAEHERVADGQDRLLRPPEQLLQRERDPRVQRRRGTRLRRGRARQGRATRPRRGSRRAGRPRTSRSRSRRAAARPRGAPPGRRGRARASRAPAAGAS